MPREQTPIVTFVTPQQKEEITKHINTLKTWKDLDAFEHASYSQLHQHGYVLADWFLDLMRGRRAEFNSISRGA